MGWNPLKSPFSCEEGPLIGGDPLCHVETTASRSLVELPGSQDTWSLKNVQPGIVQRVTMCPAPALRRAVK